MFQIQPFPTSHVQYHPVRPRLWTIFEPFNHVPTHNHLDHWDIIWNLNQDLFFSPKSRMPNKSGVNQLYQFLFSCDQKKNMVSIAVLSPKSRTPKTRPHCTGHWLLSVSSKVAWACVERHCPFPLAKFGVCVNGLRIRNITPPTPNTLKVFANIMKQIALPTKLTW